MVSMLKSLKQKEALKISKEEAYEIIRAFLDREIELVRRKMISEERFDSPSWSEYQAYQIGMLKSFDKVLDFIPNQGKTIV